MYPPLGKKEEEEEEDYRKDTDTVNECVNKTNECIMNC